jgi:hypothetical protein
MHTNLHADSLCAFIGVDFISTVDGIPTLLERVDALRLNNAVRKYPWSGRPR